MTEVDYKPQGGPIMVNGSGGSGTIAGVDHIQTNFTPPCNGTPTGKDTGAKSVLSGIDVVSDIATPGLRSGCLMGRDELKHD